MKKASIDEPRRVESHIRDVSENLAKTASEEFQSPCSAGGWKTKVFEIVEPMGSMLWGRTAILWDRHALPYLALFCGSFDGAPRTEAEALELDDSSPSVGTEFVLSDGEMPQDGHGPGVHWALWWIAV